MVCPIKTKEYLELEKKHGPIDAYSIWLLENAETPEVKLSQILESDFNSVRRSLPELSKLNDQQFTKYLFDRVAGGKYTEGSVIKGGNVFPLLPNPHTFGQSYTGLRNVLDKLSSRFGIPYQIIHDEGAPAGAFINNEQGSVVIINTAKAGIDTPFHEYYHPFIHILKKENYSLYSALLKDHGSEEAMVEALGKLTANKTFIANFLSWLRSIIRDITGQDFNITNATSLQDVMDLFEGKLKFESEEEMMDYQTLSSIAKSMKRNSPFSKREDREDKDKVADTHLFERIAEDNKLLTPSTDKYSEVYTLADNTTLARGTVFVNDSKKGIFRSKKEKLLSTAEYRANSEFLKNGLDKETDTVGIEINGKIQRFHHNELVAYLDDTLNRAQVEGDLLHAYAEYSETPEAEQDKRIHLESKLSSLADQLGYDAYQFHPLINGRSIEDIKNSLGIPKGSLSLQEVVIVSKDMGVATAADGIYKLPNGEYLIIDYKTGKLSDSANQEIQFGEGVLNSSYDRAAMTSVLRMVMLQYEYGKDVPLRFAGNVLVKCGRDNYHDILDINIETYLVALDAFFKETNPELHAKMVERNLFSADSYISGATIANMFLNSEHMAGLTTDQKIQLIESELAYIQYAPGKFNADKAKLLAQALAELKKQDQVNLNKKFDDLNGMKDVFKNMSDIPDQRVQTLNMELQKVSLSAAKEGNDLANRHNELLAKAITSDTKSKVPTTLLKAVIAFGTLNMAINPLLGAGIVATGIIGNYLMRSTGKTKAEIFAFMWAKNKAGIRVLNTGDTYQFNGNTFRMTLAQIEYRDFCQETMADLWGDVMSRRVGDSTVSQRGRFPDELPENFAPIMPPTYDDLRRNYTGKTFGILTAASKMYGTKTLNQLTARQESNPSSLPIQFYHELDAPFIQDDNFSYDFEAAFLGFTGSLLRKKHFDPVIPYAEGIKAWVASDMDSNGNQRTPELVKFLDSQITMQVFDKNKPSKFTSRKLKFTARKWMEKYGLHEGETYEINQDYLIRCLKNLVSFSVMSFKLISPAVNFIYITFLNASELTRGLMSSALGINSSYRPRPKDIIAAYGDYLNLIKLQLLGREHESKIWNLAKASNWIPDNQDTSLNNTELLSSYETLSVASAGYMFNNFAETYGSIIHLSVMLRANKDSSGKSFYDSYDNNANWIGKPRGKKLMGNGSLVDLNELDEYEWKNLKRAYEKLHGSYRKEERTAIEVSVYGQFFTQFKRYFFTYMKNLWASPYRDITSGMYKIDNDYKRPDNVPVHRWESEMMQGRFRALAGALWAPSRIKQDIAEGKSPKRELMYLANTALWFAIVSGLVALLGGGDDDDKSYLKWRLNRLTEDMTQGASPRDVISAIKKPMVVVDRISTFTSALGDVLTLEEDSKGNLKGVKALRGLLPSTASQDQYNKSFKDKSSIFTLELVR